MANTSIDFKDRRVQIILAAIGVLALGGAAFFAWTQFGTPAAETPPPVVTNQPGTPPGMSPMGNPGTPGGGPTVTPPTPTTVTGTGSQAAGAPANSFVGVPPLLQGPGGTMPSTGAMPPMGADGMPMQTGMTPTAPGAATSKPKPIREGVRAAKFRFDPFVSIYRPTFFRRPAFALALPRRIASRPNPFVDTSRTQTPEQRFGPLPYVQRRVSGVLYNGVVSAILETGDAQAGSTVEIVQPGSVVDSGIPGVPKLTVESITATKLVLRAPDGRSTAVELSALPPGVADQLRRSITGGGGGIGGGDVPGGQGGISPGPAGFGGGAGGPVGVGDR